MSLGRLVLSSNRRDSRWSTFALRLLLFGTLCLGGCAALPDVLKDYMSRGEHETAVAEGQAWIDKADPEEKKTPEGQQIARLVAEARLEVALKRGSVKALRAFRTGRFGGLRRKAKKREGSIYFKSEASPKDTVAAYRTYRQLYPHGLDMAKAKRREVKAAERALKARPSEEQAKAFLAYYDKWPEAKAFKVAQRVQIEAALKSARRKDTISDYQAFLSAYADWPGGAAYLEQALDSEVKKAHEIAQSKGGVRGLKTFLKEYGKRAPKHPLVRAAGLETLRREHAAAIKTGTVDALRTFRQTYYDSFSDDERVKDALEREMKLAYDAIVLNQNVPAWRAYRQNMLSSTMHIRCLPRRMAGGHVLKSG